jgi:hypothetical protein
VERKEVERSGGGKERRWKGGRKVWCEMRKGEEEGGKERRWIEKRQVWCDPRK